ALATGANSPDRAEQLAMLAATVFKKLGDETSATNCHRETAEMYLAVADKTDALSSIGFIEKAIDALRRAGGPKEEIQKLNKLLTEKGRESLTQMQRINGPAMDFSATMDAAKKSVEGLSPIDALRKLAFQFPILSYDEHKARVEKSIQEIPLAYFIEAKSI